MEFVKQNTSSLKIYWVSEQIMYAGLQFEAVTLRYSTARFGSHYFSYLDDYIVEGKSTDSPVDNQKVPWKFPVPKYYHATE